VYVLDDAMTENIFGPGGVPALLLKYLKQTPDSTETIDIGTPARRYNDTYTKRILTDAISIAASITVPRVQFGDGTVVIGDTDTTAEGKHAVVIGAGAENPVPHTVRLGCNEVVSISATAPDCDLGTTPVPFKRLKLSQGVEGFFVGNTGSSGGPTRLALGDDANNVVGHTVLLGDPLCTNVYPNNDKMCDLGLPNRLFGNVRMWGDIVGVNKIIPNGISVIHGQNANALAYGVSIGANTNSGDTGVAVGAEANSQSGGTSVGWGSNAQDQSTAVGKGAIAVPGATVIGDSCVSLAAGAHVFGVGVQNSEAHTLVLGDSPNALLNVRPDLDLVTDLGTSTNKFKTIFVNHIQTPVARFVMDSPFELKSGDNQDLLFTPTPDSSTFIPATTTTIGDCFKLTLKGDLDTVVLPSTGTITLGTVEQGKFIEHKFEINSTYTEARFVCEIDCNLTTSGMNTYATFTAWKDNDFKSVTHSASYNQSGWDTGLDHTVTLTYSSSDINVFRPKEIFFRRV
jgi:hypothetical protein